MSTGIIDQAMDYLADFVNNAKITETSSWDTAYNNAKFLIVAVGKAVVSNNNIAMTIVIPKIAIDTSAERYWQVSDGYGTGGHTHFQVKLTGHSLTGAAIYTASGSQASPQEVKFYYF